MNNKLLKFSLIILLLAESLLQAVYALPPPAPRLQMERSGLLIKLNWEDDHAASGYRLHYAVYPSATNGGSLDVGKETFFSATLWNGAAFYVWLTAYNSSGESQFSNIEHFVIDNKVVAFLSTVSFGAQLRLGLEEAFAGITNARLETIFVDLSDNQKLKDLFFGTADSHGYKDDPDVLAVITDTTAHTLALTSQQLDKPMLIISCVGTSTVLKSIGNVLALPPDNAVQAELIYKQLTALAARRQARIKYVILLDRQPGMVFYGYDLYSHLLQQALSAETTLQQREGLDETGKPAFFPQLEGTFIYSKPAESDQIATIITNSAQLGSLKPDTALHIGSDANFYTLTEKHPEYLWIGSDSTYDYALYRGKNVAVVTLHGGDKEYGYDAGGFLRLLFNSISGDLINREGILSAAKHIVYKGRTGDKGFNTGAAAGSYDMFVPGPQGWIPSPF